MIPRRLLVVVVVVLVASACSASTMGPTPVVPGADGRIPFAVLNASDTSTARPRDGFELVTAQMEGDALVMDVRFGGGCKDHAFVLLGTLAFAESMPVQTPMRLVHDGRGDRCRALLSHRLRADISPLRDVYRRAYQVEHGTIAIHLHGTIVRYTF